jgi:hypothetical protein
MINTAGTIYQREPWYLQTLGERFKIIERGSGIDERATKYQQGIHA